MCLQGRRRDVADAMADWVRSEAYDKQQQWWDTNSWPRVYLQPGRDIPWQRDGHSCGLYAAVLADCIGAGVPLQHCRMADADAVAVRARLLDNICTGAILRLWHVGPCVLVFLC
jgi:Ulp1 family protease